LVGRRGLEPL